MNARQWKSVNGIVTAGHRVASGSAFDSPYPRGTIEIQAPFFQGLGLDLADCFKGTLNISITPSTFQLIQPEFTFRGVEWTDRHPPEDFSALPVWLCCFKRKYPRQQTSELEIVEIPKAIAQSLNQLKLVIYSLHNPIRYP